MKISTIFTFPYLIIFLSALLDVVSLILIKKFINNNNIDANSLYLLSFYYKALTNPVFVTALILFILSPILFFVSLTYLNLSVSFPVNISFKMIILLLLAIFILKEELKLKNIAGILLLIIAIFLLN